MVNKSEGGRGRDPQRRFSRNRLTRGRGLRKTTGCLTCRRRHVKCDEAKPFCAGCAKRNVECIYSRGDGLEQQRQHKKRQTADWTLTTSTSSSVSWDGAVDNSSGDGVGDHRGGVVCEDLSQSANHGYRHEEETGDSTIEASDNLPRIRNVSTEIPIITAAAARGGTVHRRDSSSQLEDFYEESRHTLQTQTIHIDDDGQTSRVTFDQPIPESSGVPNSVGADKPRGSRRRSDRHRPDCDNHSNQQQQPLPGGHYPNSEGGHSAAQASETATATLARPPIPHYFGGPTPGSISTTSHDSPTARWLDLLIGDVTLNNNGTLFDADLGRLGIGDPGGRSSAAVCSDEAAFGALDDAVARLGEQVVDGTVDHHGHRQRQDYRHDDHQAGRNTSNTSLQERLAHLGGDELLEKQAWHSSEPLRLSTKERRFFRHFVQHVSSWMDLFEPKRPFGTFVPHLALHNVGLMNAVLALSLRHLSLDTCDNQRSPMGDKHLDAHEAVRYYYKALHYSQQAMRYDTYKVSLELLAISIIISTYEMLGGASKDWERHLKGVFWIQRSQIIHGDSGGLRQGIWWAWLCQDVWAAFRERRRPFTFWKPTRALDTLDQYGLAARSVYLFAQVVGFCSDEEVNSGNTMPTRMAKADALVESLEDWRSHLTIEFEPLPVPAEGPTTITETEPFRYEPVWIQPPAFAVSVQLYYCSLILMTLHRPQTGGMDDYLNRQSFIQHCIRWVCGIAITLTDYASGVICSQCVFIAGIPVQGPDERAVILQLLRDGRRRTGWPVPPLDEELSRVWAQFKSTASWSTTRESKAPGPLETKLHASW